MHAQLAEAHKLVQHNYAYVITLISEVMCVCTHGLQKLATPNALMRVITGHYKQV